MAADVKRAFVVAWSTLPYVSPRSVQVGRNLGSLSALGWDCNVICADFTGTRLSRGWDRALERRYLRRATIHRVHAGGLRRTSAFFKRLQRKPLPLPDEDVWWGGALQRIGTLDVKSHDVLLTFAQPWIDHLVGLEIKRWTGLPWIAHFSDPWVDSPYYRNVDSDIMKTWRHNEREVVAAADRVIFTNRTAMTRIMAKYPEEWQAKAVILPHSFDASDCTEGAVGNGSAGPTPGRVRLVHAGRFYGIRWPDGLLAAMRLLREAGEEDTCPEVDFLGGDSQKIRAMAASAGVDDLVRVVTRIPPSRLATHLRKYDGLLVIDAPAEENLFLPSKAVDYLALERPLVGLTPPTGATAEFLADLGFRAIPPDDPEAIIDELQRLHGLKVHHQRIPLPSAYHQARDRYEMGEIGRKLSQIMSDVVG